MRFVISTLLTATVGAMLCAPSAANAQVADSYSVEINKTEILRLPQSAATVIVGNPLIADVTVQSVDTLFIVGRGYGETNLIILDRAGQTMMNTNLQVVNTLPKHNVRVYNGSSRETYSCIPFCGPSPVLGDSSSFVSANRSKEPSLAPTAAFSSPTQSAPTTSDFLSGAPTAATTSQTLAPSNF